MRTKQLKSVLLCAAASVVTVAGAQAEPVQYVKICDAYGAGFYYIPGTDTCIKLGGYVRTETNLNMGGSGGIPGTLWLNNRNQSWEDWRTRALVSVDTRSQTEYGTLRSYLNFAATSDMSGTSGSAFPAPNNERGASGYVRLYAPSAFIQFAGFTFGKTDSFFNFDTMGYTNSTSYWGSNEGGNGVHLWGYTAQFGNGFSATLSLENGSAARNGITPNEYANETWPDLVTNLRVDQSWGSAQIMAALHNIRAQDFGGYHPDDRAGFAVGAGARFNMPTGPRDYFQAQFTYTEGALRYLTGNNGTDTLQIVMEDLPATRTAYGPLWDAVVLNPAWPTNSLDLTRGWSFTAGVEKYCQPNLKFSVWGDYGYIEYSGAASMALGYTDASWSLYQIGSRAVWTPVPNLDVSAEIIYNRMEGADTGVAATSSKVDWASAMLRVQRSFFP